MIEETEKLRLTISLGIIASGIGAIAFVPHEGLWILVDVILGISIFCSILYTLATASKYKYKDSGMIWEYNFSEGLRQNCYDYSIDTYGINLTIFMMFAIAYMFGWNWKDNFLDVRLFAGGVVAILIATALQQFNLIIKSIGKLLSALKRRVKNGR